MYEDIEKLKQISRTINKFYLNDVTAIKDVGLFHGKTGICIYFYHLGKKTGNTRYKKFADNLIDEIVFNFSKSLPNSIEKGIAGIGIGIEYLIQNEFIECNADDVLEIIDNRIFKNLSFELLISNNYNNLPPLLETLIYFLFRLKNRKKDSDNYIADLLANGAISVINKIEQLREKNNFKFEEPPGFQLFWMLPLYLCILSELFKLNIYTYKIERICDNLSRNIISFIPLLHCNRIYLSLAIKKVNDYLPHLLWEEHANRLISLTDIHHILDYEIKNKQLFLKDGLAGIFLISELYNKKYQFSIVKFDQNKLIAKLANSEIWKDMGLPNHFSNSNIGGLSGLLGVNTLINSLLEDNFYQ